MRNIGNVDRLTRIILGFVLLAFAFADRGTPWTVLGFVPLLTGLAGYCPLYHLLRISTNPAKKYA